LHTRNAVAVVPLIAVGMLLSGCAGAPERAATVGTQSAAPASQQRSQAPKPNGAGDLLTAAQAKSGLLAVGDMPTGWAGAKNDPESTTDPKIEPVSCQKMFDDMGAKTGVKKAKVKQKSTFSEGGMLGTQLVMEIASFEDEAQGDKVEAIASALTKCSTISSTQDGQTAELTLNGLSFPNLGDQTLALRANVKMKDIEAVTDMVFVAVGHNIVSFTTVGFQPMKGADLEEIARTGMARVAQAAKS
jgi:hypothetical protein